MNLILLYKKKKERSTYLKKGCGIRYTVKVAKDTDRVKKKNFFRLLKTLAQITYHSFDSRQSNTEEEEHI